MSPQIALLLTLFYILWLFRQEKKRHPKVSNALWVPLLWLGILGSRPLSLWLGFGGSGDPDADPTEGSPFDRLVFLGLIVAGLAILSRRRVRWSDLASRNTWLFLFFVYLGLSAVWSDYPFVSFKRWIKDVGNIVMVVVVLTEKEPVEAAKALFERCGYFLMPMSLLFIKYFPDLGRAYTKSGESMWVGVTTSKNTLGMTILACGLGMTWSLLDSGSLKKLLKKKSQLIAQVTPILLTLWLLLIANSSTSLLCGLLGTMILVGAHVPVIRVRMVRIGLIGAVAMAILLPLASMFNAGDAAAGAMGRDLTFTGRVDIWKAVLKEDINPLLGAGYYSFWIGDRAKRVSEGFYYELNEAHNGYLETYLNSGLIGLALLLAVLIAAAGEIKKQLQTDSAYAGLRLALLLVGAVHNLTESSFDRLSPLWFVWLLAAMKMPVRRKAGAMSGVVEAVKSPEAPTGMDQAVPVTVLAGPSRVN